MGLERKLAFLMAGILTVTSCNAAKKPLPHQCPEVISGLASNILLPEGPTEFGAGTQIVVIGDRLAKQPILQLDTTDSSCTRTTLSLVNHPSGVFSVGGALYYPDKSTYPEVWQAVELNYQPDPEDNLLVNWHSWKVTQVSIQNPRTGQRNLTLIPPSTPTSQ